MTINSKVSYIPGTKSWTMAVFKAEDVPEGTEVGPIQVQQHAPAASVLAELRAALAQHEINAVLDKADAEDAARFPEAQPVAGELPPLPTGAMQRMADAGIDVAYTGYPPVAPRTTQPVQQPAAVGRVVHRAVPGGGWYAHAQWSGQVPSDGTLLYTAPAAGVQGDTLIGMSVSIDVSTGDDDAGNRLFGTIDDVQQYDSAKHGLMLLITDPKPNFTVPDSGRDAALVEPWRELKLKYGPHNDGPLCSDIAWADQEIQMLRAAHPANGAQASPELINIGSMMYQGRSVADWVIAAKGAQAGADKLDAERYRWLRNKDVRPQLCSGPYVVAGQSVHMLEGEQVDKAVDAAILAAAKKGGA